MKWRTRVERVGPGDLMDLASDVGPAPMNIGMIIVLDAGHRFDLPAAEAALMQRVQAIPRLRQRLVDPPWGCGRAIWVDVPDFDVGAHLDRVRCTPPGDRAALLEEASAAIARPLPRSRPLWRAVFVTGLAGGQVALVVVFHHVLADGIGGLAVLNDLVDGAHPARAEPARPRPTNGQLLAEATAARLLAIRRLPGAVGRIRAAAAELGTRRRRPAAVQRCSLNVPTGPRRRFATVEVALEPVRAAAHSHGATINDVLLAAVTGALNDLLHHRGENVPALVVSVPVSARQSTTTNALGNDVGVMSVRVSMTRPVGTRLAEIASMTRGQKSTTRGSSALLVGPAFRLLDFFGMLRWFMERQRLVNTFLTNLHGPEQPLQFNGALISALIPVTVTAGNVSVAFAALSYAGTVMITVIVDPDLVPDLSFLTAALESALHTVSRSIGDSGG